MSTEREPGADEYDEVLNMSDEELENYDPYAADTTEDPSEDEQDDEQESLPEPDPYVGGAPVEDAEQDTDEEEEVEKPSPEVVSETREQEAIDYKGEYERLLSPFRASKRDIQVKNIDDARRLMQMGADYQFKMQALKPQMRILRALEKNGLLDQDKINFLIDLDKKNPEAVKKYFKDKQIDPLDLDLNEETTYRPKSYTPSDQEVALDDILDEIRETPTFQRTIDELGSKWDAESKKVLMERPGIIKVINDQIQSGIYDQVMSVVENERLMGRLEGLNDLMAYKTVGDALQAQGAFKHLADKSSEPRRKASQDQQATKLRKRAAGPTKRSSPTTPLASDFNPLALSDEEFERLAKPVFA